MDNQNNSNSPFGMPTPPPTPSAPVWPPAPPIQTPPQPEPPQPPPESTPAWTPPTAPFAPQPEASSAWPTATPTPDVSSWTPPVQTPVQPEPTPTFTPPPAATTTPPLSPLDNPWGSPAQPPKIDGSESVATPTQPSWTGINTPSAPTESVPTDLSHLISSNDVQQPVQSVPETLVVPSVTAPTPDVPTLSTENHKGFPKWLIGLGAGLLVLVLGASAYFILGIGQPAKETTSLPATTAQTSQIKPPAPITTPRPAEQPVASGSANFGALSGSANASPTATSAADLLRQRQSAR